MKRNQFGKNNVNFKHGMKDTHFYTIWKSFKARCKSKNPINYKVYGVKGIKVCRNWQNFLNFKQDMYQSYLKHCKRFGEKNTTIDRIDNNKGYLKENCRWATHKEQQNNLTNNILITFKGKKDNINNWSKKLKIKYKTLSWRLNNWSIEKSFNTPVRNKIIKEIR